MTETPGEGSPGPAGQPPGPRNPYGQAPPYGQVPPYGQAPPYGQYGYAQGPPYGQNPYGYSPYGQWVPPAPKPGVIPLRPLNVGEILDGAFTALRKNPKATLGLAAIVTAVYGILVAGLTLIVANRVGQIVLPSQGQQLTGAQARHLAAQLLEGYVPLIGGTLVLAFLSDTILTGLLTSVVGHSVLGRRISIGEAWRMLKPRFWPLVGAIAVSYLICGLIFAVGSGISVGIGIALIAGHVAPLGVLVMVAGVLAALVFTIIFQVRYAMVAPAVMLEGCGPVSSLERSWRLVRKSSWRVFGIMLLAAIVVGIATVVLEIPFTVVNAIVGGAHNAFFGQPALTSSVAAVLISAVGTIVAGSVARPVQAGVHVLLYVDLRMRREGLDLVLQSAASRPQDAPAEFAPLWTTGQPPPDQQRW